GKDGKGVNIKGSFPSASNLPATGTQGDAYLVNGQLYVWTGSKWENVGNIQGPKGDKGEKGDVGATGPQGMQGVQGIKGDKGDKGDVGATGPQGIQGIQGLKGDNGAIGSQGIQGVKGDKGDIGPQGPQGIQGIKGDKGDKGDVGATGPQGIQGIQGLKGDKGATGSQGIQGVKGDKGDIGPQGPQGIKGDKGDKGDVGATGPKGDKGDSFANGTAINQMLVWNGTAWVAVAPPTTASQVLTFNNGKIGWETSMNMLPLVRTFECSTFYREDYFVFVLKYEIIHFGGSDVTEYGFSRFYANGSYMTKRSHTDNIKVGVFFDTIYTSLHDASVIVGQEVYLYYKAFATNSYGTGYGNMIKARVELALAEFNPLSIIDITSNSVNVKASINTTGGMWKGEKGFCWSTSPNPTINNDFKKNTDTFLIAPFTDVITGLEANTTYYIRAYATNLMGTSYSNELSFKTNPLDITNKPYLNHELSYGSISYNGYIYPTIKIGNQTWMAENLRTEHYNDGTVIPYLRDSAAWVNTVNGAYSFYNNRPNLEALYGKLYNWYAVNTGKLCPKGWHIPTKEEWTSLITYLSGDDNPGGKMKSTGNKTDGTGLWSSPNTGATNESGFSGLPGGARYYGDYAYIGNSGFWWSSTVYSTSVFYWPLIYDDNFYEPQAIEKKVTGMSCRCLKD
ncbi:MAG TPA: FISUMP domain-containing protein, partial [Chitinophagales bacterium]|nr:FISUMP domain-containing protein [Chitinophagales bacterium]